MDIEKRKRKKEIVRRINCLNKFDYSLYSNSTIYHNKSIDLNLNKSNKKLNTTDFCFKENLDKNKTIKVSYNNYINKKSNNVSHITNNNIICNKTLNERNSKI